MSTAPQINILPQYVDPRKLANQGIVLDGQIEPDQCIRLSESVLSISTPVIVSLVFGTDEQGRREVTGVASGEVRVSCQRCLEPVQVALASELAVKMVWSDDEARSLPREAEAWVVEEDKADLVDLIEEELLLALPIVSYHEIGKCTGNVAVVASSETEEELAPERKNPFEVLAQLKD